MKLLVLAQIPPPVHGQSVMVQTLVTGLPAHGIALHHVNLGLSRDAADIGRWRPGKLAALLLACLRTVAARFSMRCDTLYYVPAPGKRSAVYRDWLVLLLCRPFFKHLVLHWHAAGLADWLATRAGGVELWLTRRALGRADLAIILDEALRPDAAAFAPATIRIVPNGIADPVVPGDPAPTPEQRAGRILFLGLCCEEKGLFAAASAVLAANLRASPPPAEPAFTLTAAGPFADAASRRRFADLCTAHPGCLRHAGEVGGEAKARLLRASACLCLPSQYPAEGQPLVILEALAHDLPVVATRWRAIPGTVPPEALLVEPGDAPALAAAFEQLRQHPPAPGVFRRHFLDHYTAEQHLARLAAALSFIG